MVWTGDIMIAIGCDHGGVELKDSLVGFLRAKGVEVCDLGTQGRESVDYPDYGREVSERVSAGEAERGVLVCTSGIGMSIIANKFPGVRAALVHDLDGARSSREHNDANILVLSGAKTAAALGAADRRYLAGDAVCRRAPSAAGRQDYRGRNRSLGTTGRRHRNESRNYEGNSHVISRTSGRGSFRRDSKGNPALGG